MLKIDRMSVLACLGLRGFLGCWTLSGQTVPIGLLVEKRGLERMRKCRPSVHETLEVEEHAMLQKRKDAIETGKMQEESYKHPVSLGKASFV